VLLNDRLIKIRAELDAATYHQAIQAHEKMQVISLEGELSREGRSYQLRNPRSFVVESND
jgi:hypothetical protein